MTTGEKVRKHRENLSISQQELAEKTQYSQAAIANIERGVKNLPVKRLIDMARALKCEPIDLLPDTD